MSCADPYSLLPIVVADAARGVDILTHYRRFYAALLADPELHERFIEALQLLEGGEAGGETNTCAPLE